MSDMNKEYAQKRDLFIPDAVAYADKKHKVKFPGGNEAAREAWTAKWNLAFHTRMDELCGATKVCPACKGSGRV